MPVDRAVDEITALEGCNFERSVAMVLVDTVRIGAVCPTENPPPLPTLPKWRAGGMNPDDVASDDDDDDSSDDDEADEVVDKSVLKWRHAIKLQDTWTPVGPSLVPLDSYGVWDNTVRTERGGGFGVDATYRPYYEVAPSSVAGASEFSGANAPMDESGDENDEVKSEQWSTESHSEESHHSGGWFCECSWLAPILGPPELPDEVDGEADGAGDAQMAAAGTEEAAAAVASVMDAERDAAVSATPSEKGKPSFRKAFGMRASKAAPSVKDKYAKKSAAPTNVKKKKGDPDPPPKCPWMTGISRKQRTMELQIARPVAADYDIEETGPVWEDMNKISVKDLTSLQPTAAMAAASKAVVAAAPL